MKIYLASRYTRREELLGYWKLLESAGHEIVSSWVDGHHEVSDRIVDDGTTYAASDDEILSWAVEDVDDLHRAECVIHFTGGGGRGGRHTEFGIALGLGLRCVIIGPRENVFHYMPKVEVHETLGAFLAQVPTPV